MKRLLQSFVFMLVVTTVHCNTLEKNNEISGDTLLMQKISDVNLASNEKDSLEKAYSMVLFNLRMQNEHLERSLIKTSRIVAVLFIVVIALGIMLTLITSRKTYFAAFPYFRQRKGYQSGIVCLQMMHKYYYGKKISYKSIIKNSSPDSNPNMLTIEDMAALAESLGFDVRVVKADLGDLYKDMQLPVLLYMPNHMAVLYTLKDELFHLSDPYYGFVKLNMFYFATSWFVDEKNLKGIALQLYPLKSVKNSINKKLNLEKFTMLKSMDKKSWKSYGCELDISMPG